MVFVDSRLDFDGHSGALILESELFNAEANSASKPGIPLVVTNGDDEFIYNWSSTADWYSLFMAFSVALTVGCIG